MLRISSDHVLDIVDHALQAGAEECVGVLVRHVNTHEGRIIRLTNIHPEPGQNFEVAEKEIHRLYRGLAKTLEYVDVLYHSHTEVEAIPSSNDQINAELEDVHYVIVALNGRGKTLRSWTPDGVGGMAEEEVVVLTGD